MIKLNKVRLIAFFLAIIMFLQTLVEPFNYILAEENIIENTDENIDISVEWESTEFTNGSVLNIVEPESVKNIVKLKVSYSSEKVKDSGYSPGELIITVKGIGGVNREEVLEAIVGADKIGSSTKQHDWSYTWNKYNDTYTFTNNNKISSNSVFSGYFELVWNIQSRDSIHNYTQNDIQAKFLLLNEDDEDIVTSNILTFSNQTTPDVFTVDIEEENLSSYEGLTNNLENPNDYIIVKYLLSTTCDTNSRGLESSRYLLDVDSNNMGDGAFIIDSSLSSMCQINDSCYEISSYVNQYSQYNYVYVAYPKSSYSGKTINTNFTMYGSYYEGDEFGNIEEKILSTDDIEKTFPIGDILFPDITGGKILYSFEKKSETAKSKGYPFINGITKTFYLNGYSTISYGNKYTLELTDDYIFILQNDENYRQLTSDDYNFESIIIPSVNNLKNINNKPLQSDKYPVKIYAVSNNNIINTNDENLVFTGYLSSDSQKIDLPTNTTSVTIKIEDIEESIKSFSIPINVIFHLNENNYEEFEKANLITGNLVNTSFLKVYDKDGNWINPGSSSYTYSLKNINISEKDTINYGNYLSRSSAYIYFYEVDKSNFSAYTNIGSISFVNKQYNSTFTMGGEFNFKEEERPNKFSLYSILPESVSLKEYNMPEKIWDIMTLSGFGLDSEVLAKYCTPEIITNYKDSGRTYIALHFDFEGMELPQNSNIYASFPVIINRNFFVNSIINVNIRSSILIDETIYMETEKKYKDNGGWEYDKELASDIDNDGNIEELLSSSYSYTSFTTANSAQFEISKDVICEHISDSDIPLIEYDSEYSYILSFKNGYNTSKNITIIDVLENTENSKWKGTFQSIEISNAEELGLDATILYSKSENPGPIGGTDWFTSLNPSDVKAIAIDCGEFELDAGEEIKVLINMKAPNEVSLKNEISENKFSVSATIFSLTTNTELTTKELNSNAVQLQLSPELKNILVTKVDSESKVKLSDAEFVLINKETNEIFSKKTTNSKGYAIFENIPADTSYILKETKSPYGYELSEVNKEIIFDKNESYSLVFEDIRTKGTIEVHKTNELDNTVLVKGAEYSLYNKETNDFILSAITDENGIATFSNISWGDYYIKETKSPEGYQLNETIYDISMNRENVSEIQVINTSDKQTTDVNINVLKLEKLENGTETINPLSGCIFELSRKTESGNIIIGTYVTDENGMIQLGPDLPYGTYIIRETRTLKGYYLSASKEFDLTPTNRQINLTFYNQRKYGNVLIIKKDNLGNTLEGVEFTLYDSTKTNILETYTTDEYGNIDIKNLEWGTYYLKETKNLKGYAENNEYYEIKINGSNLNINLDILNETLKGSVILTKTDEDEVTVLPNAVYNLYKSDGSLYLENLTTDENGQIYVENLEWGSYYFKETQAPTGYVVSDKTIRFSVNIMNAGITQYINVTDPIDSKQIIITKKIKAEDINFDNGNPTFLFKVTGTDVNEKEHTYYQVISFNKEYTLNNTTEDGYISQNIIFSELLSGNYTVSEEETSRYEFNKIEDVINGVIKNNTVEFNLIDNSEGSATYVNKNYEQQYYSDTQLLVNILKEENKYTALRADWNGQDEIVPGDFINKDLIDVYALYDDGSSKKLDSDAFTLDMERYPMFNGTYDVTVTYTEKNITKSNKFELTINNGKKEMKQLRAVPIYEDMTYAQGSTLKESWFVVEAVYTDNTTEILNGYDEYVEDLTKTKTITSPNYPNNYYHNMTESRNFWEVEFEDADAIKIVFSDDSRLESTSYDYVQIYDSTGQNISGKLGGNTIAGKEIIVEGNYAKLTMRTDGSVTYKGFSAEIIPLKFAKKDYIIDNYTVPNQSGEFDITISLNPEFYGDKDISTTISLIADISRIHTWNMPDGQVILYSNGKLEFTNWKITPYERTTNPWTSSSYNNSIKSVVIQEGRTSIGNSAFYNCNNLTSIEIPDSVTSIGNEAFYDCEDLTSIEIPNSVTSIGNYAFYNCDSLTSIEIPNSVTSIGTYAFYDCDKLTNIEIPNSVTSIGEKTFYSCNNLTSVIIPNSITTIGERAFLDCKNIETIVVSDENTIYDSRNNCNAIIETSTNKLILGCKNTIIPNSVTSIGDYAFYDCDDLTSIEIPNSVTSIGSYAFYNCDKITSIEIPNSVTSINNYAFCNCDGLTNIEIPNSITKINEGIFSSCNNLTTVTIPNTITTIGNYAFNDCNKLTNIEIPNNVTSIGNSAFQNCDGLTSIFIPSSVTNISDGAFAGCTNIQSIIVSEDNTVYDSRDNCNAIIKTSTNVLTIGCKNTIIPEEVTSIGNYAFSGCIGLTSIEIPNGVTSIGNYAFSGCTGLTNIEIPNNVTSVGNYAFSGCIRLTSMEIPNSVTSIGSYAFSGCTGLTNIEISENITKISDYTFNGCIGLNIIKIPENVTSIGNYAFQNCDGLINITIPNNVTSIGSCAFYDCDGLINITIPNNVTSIGSRAFYDCDSLTSIQLSDKLTSISSYMFYSCNALISITIPNSVTSINNYAFQYCTNLTSIYIPNSVTGIYGSYYDYAPFYNCSSNLKIYCEVSGKQSGWDTYWNYRYSSTQIPTTYNVTLEDYETNYK